MDIESIMFREILKFYILVVEFLRDIVKKFIIVFFYENMKKFFDIKIFVGEYMDEVEIIYF